jgi:tripartite ATP-independent transporter DctM subunit
MLGAVSGSGVASAAALATLASPELQRVGYTQRFSVTLAALSGSLSTIIPPSLLIMIYGSIASVPIGHLFMGAVGPAVLCMLVYLACLFLFGETAPDAGAQMSAAEGIQEDIPRNSMAAFAFVLFLMAVVFGGIYGGIVTVGEAGALGAFTALLGLSAMRRIGVRDVVDSLCESVKISAMLIILLIGAQIFSRFLSFSRIPTELLVLSQPLLEHPYLLVGVLMAGLFIAGIILEEVTIMVLAIPLILPMLEAAQIDLVWFGVMACFIISLGLLTPPVGFVTFAAATAAKVPATSIFGPVMLFATIAAIVVTASMMLYPQIITWLPSRME